jgi:hypothetical protein
MYGAGRSCGDADGVSAWTNVEIDADERLPRPIASAECRDVAIERADLHRIGPSRRHDGQHDEFARPDRAGVHRDVNRPVVRGRQRPHRHRKQEKPAIH